MTTTTSLSRLGALAGGLIGIVFSMMLTSSLTVTAPAIASGVVGALAGLYLIESALVSPSTDTAGHVEA